MEKAVSSPALEAAGIAGNGASAAALTAGALPLFQKLLPLSFFDEALARAGVRQNNRVYNAAVTTWMMSSQRMNNQPLDAAVLELICGLPVSFWPHPCKRLKRRDCQATLDLSSNTGAYNLARQALPTSVVQEAYDSSSDQLLRLMPGIIPEINQRMFFIDGTTVRAAYSPEMRKAYPPGSNQHGKKHWPILRLLVAHDLITGLASKAAWGPVHGRKRVSEQSLLTDLIGDLPDLAVLLADCNFGIFSVAYAADKHQHPVIFRLTAARAKRLYGGRRLRDGIDQPVEWKPSRWDGGGRKRLPWPKRAVVRGRLIVQRVKPSNGDKSFLLVLFTTLMEQAAELIVNLYGKRWNIETDLRTLKQTLRLDQLTCVTPEMVDKEIPIALLAYNLVRALTYDAAQKAGLTPRDFSFTRVRNVIAAFRPKILAAASEAEAQKLEEEMMYYIGQARLYRRKRRSYPRAVWPKPKSFPAHHR